MHGHLNVSKFLFTAMYRNRGLRITKAEIRTISEWDGVLKNSTFLF